MENAIADLPDGFAIESALAAYRPLVLSVCRRYLQTPEDILDVSQETYLKLAKHVASGGMPTSGWIWTAAYTSCVDFVRRAMAERLPFGSPYRARFIASIGANSLSRSAASPAIPNCWPW